ncbi:MAG: DUF4160 domain-containing protein [Pyrinomonadaceae bacterium]|nr:DUF4160 domain-containing protein [Pyrinomonadaceae bacterium]
MPTVLRQRGFDIAIRPRDHGPPHVHVLHSGEEVVILLGVGVNLPRVRENRGMRLRNVREAMNIVAANNDEFLKEWRKIYG